MDRDAVRKGVPKMSKSEAKAQARLEFKTEMYMRNVQKVISYECNMCHSKQKTWVAIFNACTHHGNCHTAKLSFPC